MQKFIVPFSSAPEYVPQVDLDPQHGWEVHRIGELERSYRHVTRIAIDIYTVHVGP